MAQASLAPRPEVRVVVSSYEYPNFNVSPVWCWIYACPKRRDLSRDPDNDLVTDAELNQLMIDVEARRIAWTNADSRLDFDHGIGEMHYYYGDESRPPGVLPRPGQDAPDYLPFPGGDPLTPTLRENFRAPNGIPADPIHLDYDGYQYKIAVQTETHFFPRFRGPVTTTFTSRGGLEDGWTDGTSTGNDAIVVGDDGVRLYYGIASFDTTSIPSEAEVSAGSLYLLQDSRAGTNPFTSGDLGAPILDVKTGSFGAPEIEPEDATAEADAADAGCFVGSAAERVLRRSHRPHPRGAGGHQRPGAHPIPPRFLRRRLRHRHRRLQGRRRRDPSPTRAGRDPALRRRAPARRHASSPASSSAARCPTAASPKCSAAPSRSST